MNEWVGERVNELMWTKVLHPKTNIKKKKSIPILSKAKVVKEIPLNRNRDNSTETRPSAFQNRWRVQNKATISTPPPPPPPFSTSSTEWREWCHMYSAISMVTEVASTDILSFTVICGIGVFSPESIRNTEALKPGLEFSNEGNRGSDRGLHSLIFPDGLIAKGFGKPGVFRQNALTFTRIRCQRVM